MCRERELPLGVVRMSPSEKKGFSWWLRSSSSSDPSIHPASWWKVARAGVVWNYGVEQKGTGLHLRLCPRLPVHLGTGNPGKPSFSPYRLKKFKQTVMVSFHISRGLLGFPHSSAGKESACNVGDRGLIPGLGRSLGGGRGNPLQYSCLDNPHG